MSTPDNRSVNFLACFAGDSITQRRGRWKNAFPSLCRKSRYQDDVLCDPFYAPIAVFTLCWQIALGGQLGPQLPLRCSP